MPFVSKKGKVNSGVFWHCSFLSRFEAGNLTLRGNFACGGSEKREGLIEWVVPLCPNATITVFCLGSDFSCRAFERILVFLWAETDFLVSAIVWCCCWPQSFLQKHFSLTLIIVFPETGGCSWRQDVILNWSVRQLLFMKAWFPEHLLCARPN